MKKILIICQARFGSTRLPGKVLKKIFDKPLLWYVVKRLEQVKTPNKIIIATADSEENKPIIEFAKNLNIGYFAGSEDDVLDRYYHTAKKYNGEVIVRITSDCPLSDPVIIDKVLDLFFEGNYDYTCNVDPPTFPDGFDIEVFTFESLERAWKEAKLISEREHVTLYIRNENNDFKRKNLLNNTDYSNYRLTVDNVEDFQLISKIIEQFKDQWETFNMQDIIKFLEENPELKKLNMSIARNEGLAKSLEEEKEIKK